jgi:TolB protein
MPNIPRRLASALALSGALASTVLGQQQQGSQAASISPDGRRILFTSDRDGAPARYLINENGSAITRLAMPSGVATGRLAWAADGAHVLITLMHGDTVRVVSWVLPEGPARELGMVVTRGARTASVFSDGSRVLVGAGDWTKMQLFSATLGQTAAKQITPDDGAYWCPAFSRDGTRIAVARMDSTRAMQAWVMQVDGSGAREVTRFTKAEGSPQCPAWSPDGRRLAVQSAVRDAADTTKFIGNIWVIDLESGGATKLAEHGAPYQDEVPTWFPDGRRIAFQSNRTGRWEIWVMNADGSGARQITR